MPHQYLIVAAEWLVHWQDQLWWQPKALNYRTKQAAVRKKLLACHCLRKEHARHRSFDNFAANLLAGLIAYNLLPKINDKVPVPVKVLSN